MIFLFIPDKDECSIPNICRPPKPNCKNIPGSYRCEYDLCPKGYERGRDGKCEGTQGLRVHCIKENLLSTLSI